MVSKKRNLEDDTSPKAKKKSKLTAEASTDKKQKKVKAKFKADKPLETTSSIVPEDIDFPRGGGTSFTPQEVKAIRAEAMTEADDLFKVRMQYIVFMLSRLICCVKGTCAEVKKATQKVGCQE
jgi:rRNA biogenesis protein RRP5